ncbi:MAG: PAS domain-containing protein, partial [Ammonifex sp.]
MKRREWRLGEETKRMLSSLGEGVVVVSADGQVVLINSLAESILGRSSERIIGLSVLDCHHPDHREQVATLIKSTLESDSAAPLIKIIDGPDVVLSVRLTAFRDEKGIPLGVVMTLRDLTEETVSSDRRENSVIQLIKIPVFKGDRILLVNTEDVVFIQGLRNYTRIYTSG